MGGPAGDSALQHKKHVKIAKTHANEEIDHTCKKQKTKNILDHFSVLASGRDRGFNICELNPQKNY